MPSDEDARFPAFGESRESWAQRENKESTWRIVVAEGLKCTLAARRRAAFGLRLAPLYAAYRAPRPLDSCATARLSGLVRLTVALMPTPLSREHLTELHCIQPITNVKSILQLGILSNHRARNVPHESVAMEEIQARRALVTIPGTNGRKLHTYANLYINGRNKMMFKLARTKGHEELCILRVATEVLDLDGVVVADRNASTDLVRFAPAPGGLSNITKELVFAQYWNHDDPIAKQRHGAIVCAEVLVPDVVAPNFVEGAYVSCNATAATLKQLVDDDAFTVTVKPYLFFA